MSFEDQYDPAQELPDKEQYEAWEAEKETRRRVRSIIAKDLCQLQRTMQHYQLLGESTFDLLASVLWGPGPDPVEWWHKPEVW